MTIGSSLARSALASTSSTCRRCCRTRRTAGHGIQARRKLHSINDQNIQQLIPSMQDLVLKRNDKIYMAMSGGVDSSVALRILSGMPLDIHVFFMRNWDAQLSESPPSSQEDKDDFFSYAYPSSSTSKPSSSRSVPAITPCGWERDWESVQRVCDHVGIPRDRVKLVDLSKEYWNRVFEPSLQIWQNGGTPNPDVACNREIKFDALVRSIGLPTNRHERERTFVATGHYARVARVPHARRLCRAADHNKDQSYFLSSLSYFQLNHAIFPLGNLTKPWVRELAKYYGLPTADREESMGLCFVGERKNFGDFVSQYMTPDDHMGSLVDLEGTDLGVHGGLWRWTVGQRARVAGKSEAHYVAKKQVGPSGQDILVVPAGHPSLLCTRLRTGNFNWIEGRPTRAIMPGSKKLVQAQIGYRAEEVRAYVSLDWNTEGIILEFEEPLSGVATGQVCAIFFEQWCLGSGLIEETWTADDRSHDPLTNPRGKNTKSTGWREAGLLEKAKSMYELKKFGLHDVDTREGKDGRTPLEDLEGVVEGDGFWVQQVRVKEEVRKREQAEIMKAEAALPKEEIVTPDVAAVLGLEPKSPEQVESVFSLFYQP